MSDNEKKYVVTHQHVRAQHERVKSRCGDDQLVRVLLPHDSLASLLVVVIVVVVGR